jgi:hypothetical protein
MLASLKKKILDIEAKISNSSLLDSTEALTVDGVETTSIVRHSFLEVESISSDFDNLNKQISDTLSVMKDADKLFVYFFNQKEGQISALNDRYMRMDLKEKILRSLEGGPIKNVISLNDSSLISPTKTFEITSSGISFPLVSTRRVVPDKITILRDSNISIGDSQDSSVRSMREALTSVDQNDVFSVHRKDKADLKLSFFCEFSKKEIINEIVLSVIRKEGQKISIRIQEEENGKILEEIEYKDSEIYLKKPTNTNKIYITVTAKATGVNQIDFKELSFYSKQYKKQGTFSTIGMPLLSNKYLTFEDLKLKDPSHLDFLNIQVRANGEKLDRLSSELESRGPFKDPIITIDYSLKDDATVFNLVGSYKYRIGSYSGPSDVYKSFVKIATHNPFTIKETRVEGNTKVIPVPVAGLENFFDVFLNGVRCVRCFGTITTGYQYRIAFTGNGYKLNFLRLENEADLVVYINSVPSYYENNNFVFPSLGLGTKVVANVAGQTFVRKVILQKDENNSVLLKTNYIQSIRFLSESNTEYNCTEKELNSTLGSSEYSIDYVNGILYLGPGISGSCEVTGLNTHVNSGLLDDESLSLAAPDKTEGFSYSSRLSNLSFNKGNIFGYQKYNGILGGVDANANTVRTIKIPSFLSLHKKSVQLTCSTFSKKEVEYIDGITELEIENYTYEYYDYLPAEVNPDYYVYSLRDGSSLAGKQFSFESSKLLSRKAIASTSSSTLNALKPLIVAALQMSGDYYVLGLNAEVEACKYLYVKKESSAPPSFTYEVKIFENVSDRYFSVDYTTNTIYTKNLPAFISESGSLSFIYSSLYLSEFTIAKSIENKTSPEGEEYNAIVYNREESKALLPYFTPILESLSVGTIG